MIGGVREMDLRKPIAINKKYKSVMIFKDGVELKESVSIQEAEYYMLNRFNKTKYSEL